MIEFCNYILSLEALEWFQLMGTFGLVGLLIGAIVSQFKWNGK